MKTAFLDPALREVRVHLEDIVKSLHDLSTETGNPTLAATLSELRAAVYEPFLFVIVGEVKAGKSSFINALLGTDDEVCKVAPDPCTDTIQQLVYGDPPQTVIVNPYLHKLFQPVPILRDLSIVDTPGTNTIIEHHQEITEGFVPRSDLIVFVFEAKNPYRQSAWAFFDYIHADWQKKVIFILQQADLMSPEDLAVNIEGVRTYAGKKGVSSPQIFAVSAKLARTGMYEASGFPALHTWLETHITGRNAWVLKIQSALSTAGGIHEKISRDIGRMEAQLQVDRTFREDIRHTLLDQEARSNRQVSSLVDTLLGEYDRLTLRAQRELEAGLNFFTLARKSFAGLISKTDSPQVWLQGLTQALGTELNQQFTLKLHEGVEEIAESIGQMARIVELKIKTSQAQLNTTEDIFGVISDRRRGVIRDLQENFARFMAATDQFVGNEIFPRAASFAPNLAAGSGVAVIGAVLTAATSITALDITGGVLSAAGLLFAGGTVLLKRGKILQGFAAETERGRQRLRDTLQDRLETYVRHIRERIDNNFAGFDALLETETRHVARIQATHDEIGARISRMADSITP
ncbi:MAG: dynamin family protein [Bacteroidia bacterium]|nr:dynamin family protein [Bacteroidia bacterium]